MKECQVVQHNNKPESEIWKNADLLAEPSEKKFMNLEAESMNTPEPEWSSIWKIMLKIVTSPRCSPLIRRKVGSSGPSNSKKIVELFFLYCTNQLFPFTPLQKDYDIPQVRKAYTGFPHLSKLTPKVIFGKKTRN